MWMIVDSVDPHCRLENPYLMLLNRKDIAQLFSTMAVQASHMSMEIVSMDYLPQTQTAVAYMKLSFAPKAIGGLVSLRIHQTVHLQLEYNDERLLVITDHKELHTAEEFLSHLPLVGQFYDQSVRSAVGQLALYGGSLLNSSGVSDWVPPAFNWTRNVLGNMAALTRSSAYLLGLQHVLEGAEQLGQSMVDSAVNVSEVAVSKTKEFTHSALIRTAMWVEDNDGFEIQCYVPSCEPGLKCYSPSCPRSRPFAGLSSRDLIRTFYKTISKFAVDHSLITSNPSVVASKL
jgi:hypothetical protein